MKNNFYISFGIWIAILPFLGIPRTGRDVLVTLSGLFLVLVFSGPAILKKLQSQISSKPVTPRKKLIKIDSLDLQVENKELTFSDSALDQKK